MSLAQSIAEAAVSKELLQLSDPVERGIVRSFLLPEERAEISWRSRAARVAGWSFDRLHLTFGVFMLFVSEALREDPLPVTINSLLTIMIQQQMASNPPTAEDRLAARRLKPWAEELVHQHTSRSA